MDVQWESTAIPVIGEDITDETEKIVGKVTGLNLRINGNYTAYGTVWDKEYIARIPVKSNWGIPISRSSKHLVVGRKIYMTCQECGKLVQLNKPIIGGLHFCE